MVSTVALAALVVLAGCSGGVPPSSDGGNGTGTVTVYVSDQQNAIDQFEHLNVTVESLTFVRANESGDGEEPVRMEVDETTLDLTELKGANASRLGSAELPNGTYTMVFLDVSAVDGTLTDGSEADVKLPSDKLRLNEEFTVGDGEEIDFVFDVSVVERGPNGYILKPVASESGTGDDVEIRDVGDRANARGPGSSGASQQSNAGGQERRGSGQSSLAFYVSDQQNAIDQFEHLNATITEIGVHRTGRNDSDGGWVERDVETTVDLTELQGANSALVDEFEIESGNYTKVFIHVETVEGTLMDGSAADVKLPSGKLRLNKGFTVGDGETVSFVYDVTVFERGPNGYILKPVAGESGTAAEVDIRRVGPDARADSSTSANASTGGALAASFSGDVAAGENATVVVEFDGDAVENATVTVEDGNDETEYVTDADGTATFPVDADATELTVTVTYDGETVELERKLRGGDTGSDAAESGGENGRSDGS